MQTLKRNFKKILVCLLTVIMCLSPILLAGCSSTNDPGGSTTGGGSGGSGSGSGSGSGGGSSGGGSSGGGSSGGGSSGGGEQEEYDPKDYFSGYKFSYRPASGNEKQFIIDVRNQNYQFTLEVMEELYYTYGHAINSGFQIRADVIACDDDGNVVVTQHGKDVFENGTNPRYSKNYFLNLKKIYDQKQGVHIQFTNKGVLQIIDPNNRKVLVEYDPNAEYGQYFSYENAIYKDSPRIGEKSDDYSQEVGNEDIESIESVAEENLTYRRWQMSIAESSNLDALDKAYAAKNFLNNHRFRAKIQFAITLITAGYDISPSGNGKDVYKNGCKYIDEAFKNTSSASTSEEKVDVDGVKIALRNDAEIKTFYENIEENLLAQYEKWVDHSGFTASEQQQIANYVCDYVIGTNLVKRDNNRFVNVYTSTDGHVYPISKDNYLQEKYTRFLTDDNLFTSFLKYSANGIYDENKVDSEVGLFEYRINDAGELTYSLQQFMQYLIFAVQNDSRDPDYELNKDFKFSAPIINVPEIGNQLFEVYDLDCDGVYHGDKYDANGDGSTTKFITENAGSTSVGTVMLYSLRLQFFKNYANTALDIVTSLAEKTTQVENSDGEMESELVYPRIPACDYANYSCGDLLANDDKSSENYGELFHMKAGYQNYQNMVLMPKKNVTLNSMWVSFKSNRDSSDAGFSIVVYARYYDATTNSYATWTQNGEETQFYNCGSQTVKNYDNGDFDFLEIDTESILSSAKIDGKEKGNAVLSPFVNPKGMETYYETQIITRFSTGGKYYEYIELPDGNRVCVFNETKVPKSQKSSYFELIFSTGLANAYQVGLPFLDFE